MSVKQENDLTVLVVYGTFGAMWAVVPIMAVLKRWLT